jgi:hypothetical protein
MSEKETKEIDEMLGLVPAEEPPKVEEPKVEPMVNDSPKIEEPPVAPPTEEPKIETPPPVVAEPLKKDETPPPPPAEEVIEEESKEYLSERVRLLTQRLEELTAAHLAGQASVVSEKPPVVATPPVEQPKVPPAMVEPVVETPTDFLEGVSIDDLLDNKAKFNEVLKRVYVKAREDAKEQVVGKILTHLPNMVTEQTQQQAQVNKIVGDFYSANEELVPVSTTVKFVLRQVHMDKPDLDPVSALKEAGDRTRKMLGIKKVMKNKDSGFESPAFAGGSGGGKPPTTGRKANDLISQVSEILTH